MTATYEQAKADMFKLVQTARDALDPPTLLTKWQGKPGEDNEPPSQDVEWMRVSINHNPNGSGQASLACHDGRRRWRRTGMLYLQFFVPLQTGGLKRAMELASHFRDAVQASTGTDHGVWFRDPVAYENGLEKNWETANASARFTYDEVK